MTRRRTDAETNALIGERLRRVRRKRGVSQAELGRMVGLGQTDISRIERQKPGEEQSLSAAKFMKIASILRVSEKWLGGNTDVTPAFMLAEDAPALDPITPQERATRDSLFWDDVPGAPLAHMADTALEAEIEAHERRTGLDQDEFMLLWQAGDEVMTPVKPDNLRLLRLYEERDRRSRPQLLWPGEGE
jgi:transcriptional regulator with XRE-family HTH domain